jgi:hypothetical protein
VRVGAGRNGQGPLPTAFALRFKVPCLLHF